MHQVLGVDPGRVGKAVSFERRHLVRIREQLAHLDGAIAADECRGATPSRKIGLRAALRGVLAAAEEHLQLREEVKSLRAELSLVKR